MLVAIRLDVADLPDKLPVVDLDGVQLRSLMGGAAEDAAAVAGAALRDDLARELVSLAVGELLAQAAVRAGASAGLLGAGAATSVGTFGVGLAAGFVVDQVVSWAWDHWSDPRGELARATADRVDEILAPSWRGRRRRRGCGRGWRSGRGSGPRRGGPRSWGCSAGKGEGRDGTRPVRDPGDGRGGLRAGHCSGRGYREGGPGGGRGGRPAALEGVGGGGRGSLARATATTRCSQWVAAAGSPSRSSWGLGRRRRGPTPPFRTATPAAWR